MKMFSALMRCIERSQADILKLIEEKQKAAERQAEQLIRELEQEITELKTKNNDMIQLINTQDHLKFLQVRDTPFLYNNIIQQNNGAHEGFLFSLDFRFTHFFMDLYTTPTGIMSEFILL